MKWTTLRLNMLPITAVEVQYACQTLTNMHNALVDATAKQSLVSLQKFQIKPFFAASQTFLSQSGSKSSLAQSNKKVFQTQPMTYEKLFKEYQRLKQQMNSQVSQLQKFYIKNSQDESARLFHMLRLKLQRCLFDCNFQENQTKKVMTKAQQEMKYNEIARNFDSNRQKARLQSISQTQKQFQESCQTFKTQNYTGYENQSIEASKNQFLQFQDSQYEELFQEDRTQNKKQYTKTANNVNLQKNKNSVQNTKRNSKQITKKLSISKLPLKRQSNSQVTIASINERQLSSQKINLAHIHNEQKSYKNLKILTNNNSSLQTINNSDQVSKKIIKETTIKQNFISQNSSQLSLKNNKDIKAKNNYSTINQKKEQQKKIITNQQKLKNIGKNDVNKSKQLQKSNFKKPQNKNNQKVSNQNQQSDKKLNHLNLVPEQETFKTADVTDLKEILMSKGSQLRFTIKMSREQYKSLLELKSRMAEKTVN